MVKRKQFIDKKTAQHFHVVHRSQRDPKANDPDASKYVLLSSKKQVEFASDEEDEDEDEDDEEEDEEESDDDMPDLVGSPRDSESTSYEAAMKAATKKSTNKKQQAPASKSKKTQALPTRKVVRFGGLEVEDLVDENGMVKDGYDYTQHMKEMGKGKFYSSNGQFASQMDLARRVELPDDVLPSGEEQERLLEAITLTTETMDGDLREALINDDAFEELDDDFVLQAADPEAEGPASGDASDGFDYDAHIAKLMAAASGLGAPKFKGNLTDSEDDDDEEDSDEEDDSDEEEEFQYDGLDRSEQQRLLDEAFEKMMAEEYDDEQVGELEEDDPETRGDVVLEGELLASIVDDFVQVRQEMLNDEGKLGNPLRSGNRLKEILEECEQERHAYEYGEGEDGVVTEEEEEEEDPAVSAFKEDAQTEQQLREMFTRNAYLAPREEEQWDCETIVSTYSNLDNHPTLIREDSGLLKKKKKKRQQMTALDEEQLALAARNKSQIMLSKKTGMPLGVFESGSGLGSGSGSGSTKKDKLASDDAEEPVIAVASRKREETKEEKKARKEAAKMDKQQRRQEKKQWKTAFKEEEQRQLLLTKPGKVSIFKYT